MNAIFHNGRFDMVDGNGFIVSVKTIEEVKKEMKVTIPKREGYPKFKPCVVEGCNNTIQCDCKQQELHRLYCQECNHTKYMNNSKTYGKAKNRLKTNTCLKSSRNTVYDKECYGSI
jgi:hypothetical protein